MHIEGTMSFEQVRQPKNRELVVAIEDPQRSQATMWVEVQSLCQKSSN